MSPKINVFSYLYEEGAEIFSTEQNKFIFGAKHFVVLDFTQSP